MDLSSREELRELSRTLEPVARQADRLGLRWILIGAAGRDLILACAGLGPATRATLDVDIAVLVASWAEFDELRAALEEIEGASADPSAKQRMHLADGAVMDLVPFGGIEIEGRIEWPPESDPVLEVRALIEAESHSVVATLPAGVQVRVPTPEVFLCLKLIAWSDRHHHKPYHDSVDLADLFREADELVGMEEMYDRHQETLKRNDHDLELASLGVLGERLRDKLLEPNRQFLVALLTGETDEQGNLGLVRELGNGARSLAQLRALLRGLRS